MCTITIIPALNGYVVQVGCQTVIFERDADLLAELARYLKAPAEVEQEYLEKMRHKPVIRPNRERGYPPSQFGDFR